MIKNEVRRKVLEQVKKQEVIDLAKKLIKIPSFSEEETEVTKFLAKFMEDNGLEVEMQEVESGRFQSIGWIRGTGKGSSIAFNGHIDIDPVPLGYTRDPFTPYVKNGRLYGHGIENMKAGVTANVMAAIALKRSVVELEGDVIVENVVGELQGGVGTDYTIKEGIVPDYAIVTEPTNLYIRTKQAGVVQFLVNILGTSRWIGVLDEPHPTLGKTVDAIEKACKVFNALKKIRFTYDPSEVHVPGLPKMIIGGIIGGQGRKYDLKRPSIMSDFCTLAIDVRFVPGMSPQSIKKDIKGVLEALRNEDSDLKYEVETFPDIYKKPWKAMKLVMPPLNLSDDEYIVQLVKRNHKYVTGEDIKKVGVIIENGFCSSFAGADSGHLWSVGTKALNYGPGWLTGFPPNAYVEVNKMVTCTKVLALTALDICMKSEKVP